MICLEMKSPIYKTPVLNGLMIRGKEKGEVLSKCIVFHRIVKKILSFNLHKYDQYRNRLK